MLTVSNGSTVIQENEYNHEGIRISKTEGSTERQYIYDNGSVAYTLDNDSLSSANILGGYQNVVGTYRGTDYYTYNKDIQGSTSSITESDFTAAAVYEYSDFGEVTEVAEDIDNEICYTGAIYDETTGLHYMNARYYDPANGRFISQDSYRGSIDDPGQWHLYVYCANNPISYVDPSGHKKRYVGVALQLQVGIGTWVVSPAFGVEFVWFNDKITDRIEGKQFHVYLAIGSGLNVSNREYILNTVKKNPKKLLSTLSLKGLKNGISNFINKKLTITVSIASISGTMTSIDDYAGYNLSYSLSIKHFTVSGGNGGHSITRSFGISTSSFGLSFGYTKSYLSEWWTKQLRCDMSSFKSSVDSKV